MIKFFFNNRINFLFLLISFFCLVGVIGIENISFKNTEWLHDGNESAPEQLAWYFFRNDIWRFPLGVNPNYGEELSSSIVFSDSIPILALFFKSLKSLIPDNFQFYSFWYFICFYLQLFFSFKILKKFTDSVPYSLIGSLFFLIAPIFIFRINWHASVSGQWLLLFALYLGLTQNINKSKLAWLFLIILSSLILYNFTVIILTVYLLLRIINLNFDKKKFYVFTKDFFIIAIFLSLTLYVVGYFQVRMGDILAVGFGVHKLNLLSIFDPVNSINNISWSWFLPDIKLSKGEELEGFNYFGLGQILMLLFALAIFINKNNRTNLFSIKNNQEIKTFILISLFLTFWALSNKISFGSYTLVEIPLNKYVFAALSVAKATGRLFWIVNYFLVIISIIIIYKCLKKKNSLLVISLFLIIQIVDTSIGIKDRINLFTPVKKVILKDQIWDNLFNRYKIVKTTYPWAYQGMVYNFSHAMEKYNIEKTNLVTLGRVNRKTAAEAKYLLYDNFRKKNLALDTIYVIDNLGHLKHLKYLFENENVGFFYRDNIWVMVMNERERMNDSDKKTFDEIKPKLLAINEKKNLNFTDKDSYYGFGWSHNLGKLGIWSEGPISTLLFRTEENYGDIKLEISCRPYIAEKNNITELDIYVNNSFNKNIKLTNNNQDENIEILIEEKLVENNEVKIDFNFKNLVSPYEMLESPDSRKLGILIKNIKINSV